MYNNLTELVVYERSDNLDNFENKYNFNTKGRKTTLAIYFI